MIKLVEKLFPICRSLTGLGNRVTLHTIKKEIEKCVILCANCHRERTAIQQDWYKYNI